MKKGNEIYNGMPWKSLDEYYELVKKYGVGGTDLKMILKKENKKKFIGYPKISKTRVVVDDDFEISNEYKKGQS